MTAFGIYPLNRYARLEVSGGLMQYKQEYTDEGLQQLADLYQQQTYGQSLFADGAFMPLASARRTRMPVHKGTHPSRMKIARPTRGGPTSAVSPNTKMPAPRAMT